MTKTLIIYHQEDNDGVFSAAIAAEYIRGQYPESQIDFIPATYAKLATFTKDNVKHYANTYDKIIMTDISFNDTDMMKLLWNEAGYKFIWIDHHAPIIKASFGKNGFSEIPGERGTDRSAILWAWKFFFDPLDEGYINGKTPYILRILSAWDSFSFDKEDINKEFAYDVNVGVTNYYKLKVNGARMFIRNLIEKGENGADVTYFMEQGHAINKAREWDMQKRIDENGDFTWTIASPTPRKAVALFYQGQTSSIDFVSAKGKAKNGIVFKRMNDGRWTVSLYNIDDEDDFHCGEYLKAHYNGGGHPGAAGCTLSEKQFIDILRNRSI